MIDRDTKEAFTFLGLGCGGLIMLMAILLYPVKLMAEYSIWTLFGKDVPWFLDILVGFVLNGALFIVFVFCMLIRFLGYEIPLIPVN